MAVLAEACAQLLGRQHMARTCSAGPAQESALGLGDVCTVSPPCVSTTV